MQVKKSLLVLVLASVWLLTACEFSTEGLLGVGKTAPSIKTKTLADVDGDFTRITTYRQPDARMYQYSLDEALKMDIPIVLEFATPGHCTVCDKQLQMLKALLNKYDGEVLFLHMDQYQNTKAFITYKVMGDPWTFIIDKDDTVRFRRAGRMLYGELDLVIEEMLAEHYAAVAG